ncbi:MAG: TIGR01906 family membrane protein [Lachnospiraceae bacterium]|nr:TIGR01906 family membrane protein [Lachnospiraceae bacterium]
MKQTPAKVCSILLSLVLALFAVSASVAVPTLWRGFYYLHIDALELPAQTGYSEDVIREAFDAMMDYEWKGADFSTGQLKWSEEGMQHFADVRVLFHLDIWVLVITALLLLLFFLFRKKIPLHRFRGFPSAFFAGTGMIVFFGIVTALAALDFDRTFTVFHRIFFPGKTNWVFDYRQDEIIRILPQVYFRNCAILAVGLIVLFCAGYILYGMRGKKRRGSG